MVRSPEDMPIPARFTSTRAGAQSLSTGKSMEPHTHGRGAAPPAPTPIPEDRTPRGRCCVSSSNTGPKARGRRSSEMRKSFLQRMSPQLMLWTALPPGARAPWMWALLRLPRFGGATYANGHDNRSGYREVGLSGPRRRCGGSCSHPPAAQATLRDDLLPEATAVLGRCRSLRLVASLVARTPGAWPHCAPDAAGLCEALCEAA